MTSANATVHVVDDDRSFRTAVGRLLQASGFNVVTYASAADILASERLDEPACILLDLSMPGLNGLELQERLAEKAPLLPIVFLTGRGNVEAAVQAMKAGAQDFLQKPAAGATLLDAVERALDRYQERRVEHDEVLTLNTLVASLTAREYQVFAAIVRGRRNKEVAYELGTTERTVKAHRHNIMEKLKASSLAEVVSIAEHLGLLDRAPKKPV